MGLQPRLQKRPAQAAAAVGRVDREVEQFTFAGGYGARNQEGDDLAAFHRDLEIVSQVIVHGPLRSFGRCGLNCGDGGQIGLAATADLRQSGRLPYPTIRAHPVPW